MVYPKKTPLSTINSGYIGDVEKWRLYFSTFTKDGIFSDKKTSIALLEDNIDYINNICIVESRLGIYLPKSYKDFIMAGGVFFINYLCKSIYINDDVSFYDLEKIGRFIDTSPDEYFGFVGSGWEDELSKTSDDNYYRYNSYEENFDFNTQSGEIKDDNTNYLEIGRVESFSYGLTENESTEDGEYEAWSVSPVYLGALRYRSFAELMVFDVLMNLFSYKYRRAIHQFDIFNDESTILLFDRKVLREQWKPQ